MRPFGWASKPLPKPHGWPTPDADHPLAAQRHGHAVVGRRHPAGRGGAVRPAVPPVRAGRGAGLSGRRRAGRAAGAGAGRRRRIEAGDRRNRDRAAALPRRSGTASGAAVAVEARHFCAGSGAGCVVWLCADGDHLLLHRLYLGRGDCARPAAGAVIDGTGLAGPQIQRPDQLALRRKGLFDPAVPGSVDRAADHHHRRAVAQSGRCRRATGMGAGGLYGRGDRRAGAGGAVHPAAVAGAGRAAGRARIVRRRGPVHRAGGGGADAQPAFVDRARRVRGGRDAGRFALSA